MSYDMRCKAVSYGLGGIRASDVHLNPLPISQSGHLMKFLSMEVSGRESPPIQSLPFHSVTHQSFETARLSSSPLQFPSMRLANKPHILEIPPFYCNLVIGVYLYSRLWPQHCLSDTLYPTTSEFSKRQSSTLLMLYCYHCPS